MAKIALAGGHSKKAPGASCYIDEYTEDRKVVNDLISKLNARGHSMVNCSNEMSTSKAELAREVQLANASGASYFGAIHFNACKKTDSKVGVEVWYYKGSSKGQAIAAAISKNLANVLGLPNRGAKATTSLYVLKHTNMPAFLVEVCFVDSLGDTNAYNAATVSKAADAIADGIESVIGAGTPVQPAESSTPTQTTTSSSSSFNEYTVKITASSLNVRSGAGTNYKVVTSVKKGGVYTIVDESNGWGKLKSGVGWIYLGYTTKVSTASSSFESYKVKITASVLNVRAGAGTGYKITTSVKKGGVYTIVAESNGWGKLKSGAGWIKLSYTQKV